MSILSIQSHVAYGHVGNSAAVFPLQRLGFEVWPVHSLQFSNHAGYPDVGGEVFPARHVRQVIDGIGRRGVLDTCQAVLSGYLGSAELGEVVLRTLAQVRDRFGSHADPVELPIGEESTFHGIADLLTNSAFLYDSGHAEETSIPDELVEAERAEHEHLVEDVVEVDDELLELYLDGTDPSAEQLEGALHQAVDDATLYPVLCGSATAPIGTERELPRP